MDATPSVGRPRFGASTDAAWQPDEQRVERSRLVGAMRRWGFRSMEDLHDHSVADPETFWREVVADLDIEFDSSFERVRGETRGRHFPEWFVGGSINAATLCAHRHAKKNPHKLALIFEGDNGSRRELNYGDLDVEVRRFAANLREMGVVRGDRVVLFLPVVPEAVVAFLGCAMAGVVSVPAFTGFGSEALAMRIRASRAVAVVTADATTRRGKVVPLKETLDAALQTTSDVRHVLVVEHLGHPVPMQPDRDRYWHELDQAPSPALPVRTGASDPLTIIYTSGTTGAPKGIVHSHAGFLTKAAVDFAYGFDVHDDDVVAWIADLGWMLGPLLIMSVLQLGATLVLTEGVPTYPTARRLWDIAERNGVTLQGIAPTAARAVMASGGRDFSGLETVRSFASTGEAWDEPTWQWLFNTVGEGERPILNYSGGTETGGGILMTYPFLPADAACFNGPLLGMDVAVLDNDAQPVRDEVGELAILNTWPGMTHSFWQDDERYLETYWSRWPGIWVHGDVASLSSSGVWRVHGRSDDTIKVSGRRVGPAELEEALLRDPRVVESAVIGVPDPDRGQRVVAFVVAQDAGEPTDDLARTAVANVGRAFAPTLHVVASLPKTKNGKIMRRAIRARYLGLPSGDMSSLDPSTPLEDIPLQADGGAE